MLQVVIQVAKRLECGAVIKYNWELTQFVFSDRLQSPPPHPSMVTIAMAGKLSSWVHDHRHIYRTCIISHFKGFYGVTVSFSVEISQGTSQDRPSSVPQRNVAKEDDGYSATSMS